MKTSELSKRVLKEKTSIDLLNWLKSQTVYPKIYWENREQSTKIAAIGKVLEYPKIPLERSFDSAFYFQSFDSRKSSLWNGFDDQTLIIPLIEVHEKNETSIVYSNTEKDIPINWQTSILRETKMCLSQCFYPILPNWKKLIEKAKKNISEKIFEKVVLARMTEVIYKNDLCPINILKKLKSKKRNSYVFYYEPMPNIAYFGTSPECLFLRKGRFLHSEAIAGTRPRGKNFEEDFSLEKELLSDEKELFEFQIVKNFIKEKLSPFCEEYLQTKNTVIKTQDVQHLFSEFTSLLKKGITDLELIKALHPTPATLGTKRKETWKFLQENEPFIRGLYAGSIGYFQPNLTEIAVGIRSCLVKYNRLYIFTGTGIVEQSNPINEWQELENKMKQFKEVLCL